MYAVKMTQDVSTSIFQLLKKTVLFHFKFENSIKNVGQHPYFNVT